MQKIHLTHFQRSSLDTKGCENKCSSSCFVVGAEDRDKNHLVCFSFSCASDSSAAGVMPSLRVVKNVRASAASVILVPRAKRHKGSSVDSLPAEKTGPLLIFRFEPFQSAPVAPPTFYSMKPQKRRSHRLGQFQLIVFFSIY